MSPFTPLELPIVPADGSLQAHLQALDLLALRLETLTTRPAWDTFVPLNSKARVRGRISNTNKLKVDVGSGWWIEMTAQEAGAYVRRRRQALLEQHARMLEGASSSSTGSLAKTVESPVEKYRFNTLFASPVAGPSRLMSQAPGSEAVEKKADKGKGKAVDHSPKVGPADETRPTKTKIEQNAPLRSALKLPSTASAAPSSDFQSPSSKANGDASTDTEPVSIQDVVDKFLEQQQNLHSMSEERKAKMKGELSADAMVTEDGLPIHEIREDEHGNLLSGGPDPDSKLEGAEAVKEDDGDDYWLPEAQARRAALRAKIFGSGPEMSDSDDDAEVEYVEDISTPTAVTTAKTRITSTATPPLRASPSPSSLSPSPPSPIALTTLRPTPTDADVGGRGQSNGGATTPRSILKPPARKKSVTFDESIPLPPDSPPSVSSSKFGFPLPDTHDEYAPNEVPIIPAPKPAVRNVAEKGFAGFKQGFLNNKPGPPPAVATGPVLPVTDTPSSASGSAPKKSLFAQRREEQGRVEEIPQASISQDQAETTQGRSGLPKMSDAKPMISMKNAVVERAPEPRAESKPTAAPHVHDGPEATGSRPPLELDDDDEEEEEEEEYEDDEYDLDDALHAREVALEYHRRLAYQAAANQHPNGDGDDDEEGDGEGEGIGGVMLGLPTVGEGGKIINPTPDDLRKYVRVGKLDNGNFVLAPGEDGWSDEESDEVKKSNVEDIRRQLLGQAPAVVPSGTAAQKAGPVKDVVEDKGLPPVVATGPLKEAVSEGVLERQPSEPVEVPKKVSRFKAARMGA